MSVRTYLALQLSTQLEKRGETDDTFARLLGFKSTKDTQYRRLMQGRSRIQTYESAFAVLGLRISVSLESLKRAQDKSLQDET